MSKIQSIVEDQTQPILINVECHLSNSLPTISIVGSASKSIHESKERIRSALSNSKIKIPRKKIIINLSPADIPKDGSYFDLPILISVMAASGAIKILPDKHTIVMGEIGLDGTIKPIRGIIGKILSAKKAGINTFWVPSDNIDQARLVQGIRIVPFKSVSQVHQQLNCSRLPKIKELPPTLFEPIEASQNYLDQIIGNDMAKRTLLIAAAGNHNLMFSGPPGSGKTMLAKSLPSILPDTTLEEKLEITHTHSLFSKNFNQIHKSRPFRSPHHTASLSTILGSQRNKTPGEIHLSHHGVLFMDELTEFSRPVIEALRQPLEENSSNLNNSRTSINLPAKFLFIASFNPCPCGYYGSNQQACICSARQITQYRKKLSGPILDRIDLCINVEQSGVDGLLSQNTNKITNEYRSLVQKVRQKQLNRASKLNSELDHQDLVASAKLLDSSKELLIQANKNLKLSTRGYLKTVKVARTIADLDNSEDICPKHISEALQYRSKLFVS